MKIRKSDIKALQTVLKKEGLYARKIDGVAGRATQLAVNKKLKLRQSGFSFDPLTLNNSNRVILALQLICRDHQFDPGPFDGFYGPQTQLAATLLSRELANESIPHFDELKPVDVNPNGFPNSEVKNLSGFYGKLRTDCKGLQAKMKKVDCPWKMKLDWDMSNKRTFFRVHERVAESVERVVNAVFDHYGYSEIKRLGLDRFSGDYVPRKMRGSSQCSTHAYGIAIDFYGSRNELRRSTSDTPPPTLAHADLEFWWQSWEKEGWYSLGRMEDRDWMHIQAAKGRSSKFFHN